MILIYLITFLMVCKLLALIGIHTKYLSIYEANKFRYFKVYTQTKNIYCLHSYKSINILGIIIFIRK